MLKKSRILMVILYQLSIIVKYMTAYCIGITQHMNVLNINLQGANCLISEVFNKIAMSGKKLQLWELWLSSLITEKSNGTKKYVEEFQLLRQAFSSWFRVVQVWGHNELVFYIIWP